jgi:hypothetical protein
MDESSIFKHMGIDDFPTNHSASQYNGTLKTEAFYSTEQGDAPRKWDGNAKSPVGGNVGRLVRLYISASRAPSPWKQPRPQGKKRKPSRERGKSSRQASGLRLEIERPFPGLREATLSFEVAAG